MQHLSHQHCSHCVAWAQHNYGEVRHGNDHDGRQFFSRWLSYFSAILER